MASQGKELKALTMSKLMANATPPRFIACSDKDRTRIIASRVERPCRKPNWLSCRSGPTHDRCQLRREAIILSKILPASSRRHIGRYADGESADLPCFFKRTRLDSFQAMGNVALRKQLSKSRRSLLPSEAELSYHPRMPRDSIRARCSVFRS